MKKIANIIYARPARATWQNFLPLTEEMASRDMDEVRDQELFSYMGRAPRSMVNMILGQIGMSGNISFIFQNLFSRNFALPGTLPGDKEAADKKRRYIIRFLDLLDAYARQFRKIMVKFDGFDKIYTDAIEDKEEEIAEIEDISVKTYPEKMAKIGMIHKAQKQKSDMIKIRNDALEERKHIVEAEDPLDINELDQAEQEVDDTINDGMSKLPSLSKKISSTVGKLSDFVLAPAYYARKKFKNLWQTDGNNNKDTSSKPADNSNNDTDTHKTTSANTQDMNSTKVTNSNQKPAGISIIPDVIEASPFDDENEPQPRYEYK